MTVSQKRASNGAPAGGPDEMVEEEALDEEALVEAMTWLHLQLEWEGVLARLRRRAGVLVPAMAHATPPGVHVPAA